MPPPVLTLEAAADFLSVSPGTLRELAEEDKVPAKLVEGEWRFLRGPLEWWLASGTGERTNSILGRSIDRLLDLAGAIVEQQKAITEQQKEILERLGDRVLSSPKDRLLDLAGKWKNDPAADALLRTQKPRSHSRRTARAK
jgi:hypothetical protein